ncbi:acyltransferase [Thermodesulfobacteriota bacterium]
MFSILPGPLCGILSLIFYTINTLFWSVLLFVVTFLKLVVPVGAWRRLCSRLLDGIATNWIGVNSVNQRLFSKTRWEVDGIDSLKRDGSYLVISNHQTWVDILVLQRIFFRRIPFLKFFLKQELLYFPVLGQAWWALDFPFMKRYTKQFLEKNPHLRGKDFEITCRACEKFKTMPVSIMNFVEGTRFTAEKHRLQQSPYPNLLRARAGGIAYVLGVMGDQLDMILDVTVAYPGVQANFWSFLCGKIDTISVQVRRLPITEDLIGDYMHDSEYRNRIQNWLNILWNKKDQQMARLR